MNEPLADRIASVMEDLRQVDKGIDQTYLRIAGLVFAWRRQLETAINRSTIDWPSVNRILSSMEELELMLQENVKK